MKQNYFEYKGVKYYTGTEITLFQNPYSTSAASDYAYFLFYDTDSNIVWYKMRFTGQNRGCSMKTFLKYLNNITGNVNLNIHMPQTKQLKDSQIPKLFIGWVWYIFLMCLLFIFKDRLVGWAILSWAFFSWRSKVIAEEGYYVEW
jgi:hypothetical protein